MSDKNIQILDEQIEKDIEENKNEAKSEKNKEFLIKLPHVNDDEIIIYLKLWNNGDIKEEKVK